MSLLLFKACLLARAGEVNSLLGADVSCKDLEAFVLACEWLDNLLVWCVDSFLTWAPGEGIGFLCPLDDDGGDIDCLLTADTCCVEAPAGDLFIAVVGGGAGANFVLNLIANDFIN